MPLWMSLCRDARCQERNARSPPYRTRIRQGGIKLWEADGVGWKDERVVVAAGSGGVAGDAGHDCTERPRRRRRRERSVYRNTPATNCDR